jgi:hypothetical protein
MKLKLHGCLLTLSRLGVILNLKRNLLPDFQNSRLKQNPEQERKCNVRICNRKIQVWIISGLSFQVVIFKTKLCYWTLCMGLNINVPNWPIWSKIIQKWPNKSWSGRAICSWTMAGNFTLRIQKRPNCQNPVYIPCSLLKEVNFLFLNFFYPHWERMMFFFWQDLTNCF